MSNEQHSDRVRASVQYRGEVQGVGFRMTAVRQVAGAAIDGWVRNEPDLSVRLEAEGRRRDVEVFLGRVRGALAERIDDEQIHWVPAKGERGGFRIQY
ncbi:acylphosphatase [Candidatus Laterigemmans baculatus]|uniref:acylphosphatase n=1 Tax=Candidatus Laterigemmans baculatus TaxID=2770505 RepID=UPI0013DD8496|nr:acylphosphatase [Candidatus Laterigemmans baculatus]